MLFASTAMRLVIRNLATNHGHEASRISAQRILSDLHDAASPFRLVTYDGTNYADAPVSITSDQDVCTQQYLSTRANGVRFRRLAGGPCKLVSTGVVSSAATALTFEFGVGGKVPYVPQPGDKLVLPLLAREFDVTSVPTPPSLGSTRGTVSIAPEPIGFTVDTSGSNVTTGYFFRRVAYTVWDNQLRFHPNFTGVDRANFVVVRGNVTSTRPFAVMFPQSTSFASDGLNLHVSLETYDLQYSARRLTNGTTTHQTVIPPRNQPTFVASTN